jgi:hypothetical protein
LGKEYTNITTSLNLNVGPGNLSLFGSFKQGEGNDNPDYSAGINYTIPLGRGKLPPGVKDATSMITKTSGYVDKIFGTEIKDRINKGPTDIVDHSRDFPGFE